METRALTEAVAAAVRDALRERSAEGMTLARARRLIAQVEAEAGRMGVKAVMAVSDAGGHPIAVACMDDAYIASYDIAVNKAFTVVSLQMSTKALSPLAQPGAPLYGIQFTNGGRIVIFGGGEPLRIGDRIVGGLGVSGGSEEQDTALAAWGLRAWQAEEGR